ncbi:hypothetical protein C7212DRAFT_342735 [Tuber magnatum]|uniref:Uncharacterized protein n=1 Tax=Tuber magnatum TaxID=42249 RepID=A0A317SVK9_9PEZI|nr:hypothetical protein C7212DRAFT_342735 [Tuber magnatum]
MTNNYQAYVEDYNSELSEAVPVVPLRRQTTKKPSGLNKSSTVEELPEPSYEGVSDSGYSSHSVASTPITETPPPPPPKAPTPAPVRKNQPSRSSSGPIPFNRPSSKSFSRTAAPAVPRNITNANSGGYGYSSSYGAGRDGSPGGGSSDCDCPDCGKTPSKSSPTISSSSSATSSAWPIHQQPSSYHHSPPYGQSPSYPGYHYPQRYDGYSAPTDSAVSDSSAGASGSRKSRSSMPPPPRPQSTFAGSTTTTSTHSSGSIPWSHTSSYSSPGYFDVHSSSSPVPPAPSTTCPPGYGSSMYAPPPLNTSIAAPPPPSSSYSNSPYAPPSVPNYGYPPATDYTAGDYYGQSTAPPTPSSSLPSSDYRDGYVSSEYSVMPPPPPIVNRRSSMRAQAGATASTDSSPDYTHSVPHHPQRRMSSRAHGGERPPSWYGQSQLQYQEAPERSYSVPPTNTSAPAESSRRRGTTPQPIRRRESNNSQGTSGSHSARLGASALSRSMEACTIDDHTPRSSHHRHSSSGHPYDSHHAVARREPGTMMQSSHSNRSSDSGSSSGHDGREELVQLTVPDSDEPFTMRYPAGVPVKLQLNGGTFQRILSFGRKSKNVNIENPIAYRYVQQRQQQVHAQLQYGAGQLDHSDPRTSAEYHHRSNGYARREMAGV